MKNSRGLVWFALSFQSDRHLSQTCNQMDAVALSGDYASFCAMITPSAICPASVISIMFWDFSFAVLP